MATLTGTTIQSTYDSLLKVTDNDAITATLKRITDGLGNNTPLYLSSSAVEIASGLNVIGSLTASNVSGSNTGDETKTSIETKLGAASASNSGYLTSSDWSTFNNKIAGVGTLNRVAKFSSTGSIADSNITDTGSIVTISGNANIAGSGGLGIAQTSLTGYNIRVSRQMTGATTAHSIAVDGFVDSTVTTQANGFFANIPVTGAFTLPSLAYFRASGSVTTGGATITTQFGFTAGGGLVNATNNYAFHSSLAAGTGRWNLYMEGTADNHLAGSLGIGSTALTGYNLRMQKSITGSTTGVGIAVESTIQSDVTNTVRVFSSNTSTQAASFTLTNLFHYAATSSALGAGSVVTNQYGFSAGSGLTTAANNFGYLGSLPLSGGANWNLFMSGSAPNHLAGSLGIGSTSLTGYNVRMQKTITGAATAWGMAIESAIQSDVTGTARVFSSNPTTQATAFTLTNLYHYAASSQTLGAGSTVTTQAGFFAGSGLTTGTNNYGFQGDIPAGTNRWNLFMSGTAGNYLAGDLAIGTTTLTSIGGHSGILTLFGSNATALVLSDAVGRKDIRLNDGNLDITNSAGTSHLYVANAGGVGIGSTALTGYNLALGKTITGAGTSIAVYQNGTVQSDVTSSAFGFRNDLLTQAATFTLPVYTHYQAQQGAIGAGTTLTTQIGFSAGTLTTGSNVFGFRGQVASGTGRWNLYMDGTANNYLAGNLAIGTTSFTGKTLSVNKSLTGAVFSTGIASEGAVQSDVTTGATGVYSGIGTQATTFTLTALNHFYAQQGTFGAGSTVTTQHGFRVDSNLTGGATNYGFRGSIPAGANRWNLFMDGTARNYLAGTTSIGSTTDNGTGALLQVAGGITYTNIFNRRANNYTLVLTDQNDIVEMNIDVTANTVTVPTNASVAFPIGTEVMIMRYGSGVTEIVPASGVTIRSKASYRKIADQYTGATLVKVGTDEWYLVGNLTA